MSVIPAARQDSDEEPRPKKPLLMDASRKWFLPAALNCGLQGGTITSTEKSTLRRRVTM